MGPFIEEYWGKKCFLERLVQDFWLWSSDIISTLQELISLMKDLRTFWKDMQNNL